MLDNIGLPEDLMPVGKSITVPVVISGGLYDIGTQYVDISWEGQVSRNMMKLDIWYSPRWQLQSHAEFTPELGINFNTKLKLGDKTKSAHLEWNPKPLSSSGGSSLSAYDQYSSNPLAKRKESGSEDSDDTVYCNRGVCGSGAIYNETGAISASLIVEFDPAGHANIHSVEINVLTGKYTEEEWGFSWEAVGNFLERVPVDFLINSRQ